MSEHVRVSPPDISVVPAWNDDLEHEITARWRDGSDDAGFALGLGLSRSGRLADATEVWRRLAHANHAEAFFALGMVEALEGEVGDDTAATCFRRSDALGSMLGAAAVHDLELRAGDVEAAESALDRTFQRAALRDERGSADAALVVAGRAQQEGRMDDAIAGYQRAESRGARQASVVMARVHLARGDLDAALESAERADEAGLAAGSYMLALVHRARKDHRQAWEAVHRAILTAAQTGDDDTLRAATLTLRPYGRVWWSRHRKLLVALALVVVAVAVVSWKWAVALSILAVVFALSQRPVVAGLPMRLPEGSGETVSLMGVSLAGDFGEHQDPLVHPTIDTRMATQRDHVMWRAVILVAAALGVCLLVWAAEIIDGTRMLRCGATALAVVTIVVVVWQWPHHDGSPEGYDAIRDPGFRAVLTLSPTVFTSSHYVVTLHNPALRTIAEHRARVRRERGPWARFGRKLLGHVPAITSLVVLATFAFAPDQGDAVNDAIAVWGSVVEIAVIVGALVVLPVTTYRAVARREPLYLLDAAGYLLAVSVVVVVAHLLGWDRPLLDAVFARVAPPT